MATDHFEGMEHIVTGSRKHGATQKQFQEFIRAADAGLRVEMHGQNYVAMSRNMYDELKTKYKAAPVAFFVDESDKLTEDQLAAIRKIQIRPVDSANSEPIQVISPTAPRQTANPSPMYGHRGGR
ncbi:hypothetical protein ABIB48_002612 [Arthrobacter sp. UYCu511]|uniref:hypothetical protein n=1 Tax=Arthrobacter sp. UYCu511 TaxID=3156337 RepID=UPI003392B991